MQGATRQLERDSCEGGAEIVLVAINAKYIHASLGLRYLFANLGDLQPRAQIVETTIKASAADVAERILSLAPRIVGIGVYIWNVVEVERVVEELRQQRPDVVVVLGGPEISYEWQGTPLFGLADYIITGEADQAFATFCSDGLRGQWPKNKAIHASAPPLDALVPPYSLYQEEDLRHRVLYVEASRGCPFTCEFCLSSLDSAVRRFNLEALLDEFDNLLDRGALVFKFVDRTFNLHTGTGVAILRFFLERARPGMFLHFEMVPDRLPVALREWIAQFPLGALQFEVGLQTLNEEVGERIRRRQDLAKVAENFRFLREETGVYIHADLILGLPGESLESFASGFDRLFAMRPHEIQLGVLKRLKGTPIVRHEEDFEMVFEVTPPYEIRAHRDLSSQEIAGGKRMARYWDRLVNSGRFHSTVPWVWRDRPSVFWAFWEFSQWLFLRFQRDHAIPWEEYGRALYDYTGGARPEARSEIAMDLWADLRAGGFAHPPKYLEGLEGRKSDSEGDSRLVSSGKRQERSLRRG